jgi:hypothetical protein
VVRAGTVDRQLRRSTSVAAVGDGIAAVALPLLATRVTRDPLAIAGVVAAQYLPWVLLALVGQRPSIDRRTAVGLADTARALALGLLGVRALAGDETILSIQLVAFVVGIGEAWTDRTETEAADVGVLSARGMLAMAAVGLPLGGLLYEIYPATPLLADVLLFTLASILVLAVRGRVAPRPTRPGLLGTTQRPAPLPTAVRPLLASAVVASLAASGLLGILVLFALVDLGLGAPAFGFLLASLAVATLVGGLAAPEVGLRLGARAGLVVALLAAGASTVVASLAADPDRPWLSALALGGAAASGATATILVRARLRLLAGRRAGERALERLHLLTWAAIPVGALVAGWLARRQSVADVVVVLGTAWVVSAVLGALGRPPVGPEID